MNKAGALFTPKWITTNS